MREVRLQGVIMWLIVRLSVFLFLIVLFNVVVLYGMKS